MLKILSLALIASALMGCYVPKDMPNDVLHVEDEASDTHTQCYDLVNVDNKPMLYDTCSGDIHELPVAKVFACYSLYYPTDEQGVVVPAIVDHCMDVYRIEEHVVGDTIAIHLN